MLKTIPITEGLDRDQSQAVKSDAPFKLIIAGPGSGKTKVLAACVAKEAMEHGSEGCVACTYTNNAAVELKDRLADMGVSGLGFVGTAHAFCLKLVTEHHSLVGLPASVTVVDREQADGLLESVMRDMGVKVPLKKVKALLPHGLPWGIEQSTAKETLVVIEYLRSMHKEGLLDFDMLLRYGMDAVMLLRSEWPYSALFVDEAQDCGRADFDLYQTMPCLRKTYVGDPDQAVMAFKGGDPSLLLGLAHPQNSAIVPSRASKPPSNEPRGQEQGVKWEVHTLQTNYRGTLPVCLAATALVLHNVSRVHKMCKPSPHALGGDVKVLECASAEQEMCEVLTELRRSADDGLKPWDCAVLCRTNRQVDRWRGFLGDALVPLEEKKAVGLPEDWKRTKLVLAASADPSKDFLVHQLCVTEFGQDKANDYLRAARAKMLTLNDYLDGYCGGGTDDSAESMLEGFDVSPESRKLVHRACLELSRVKGEWTLKDLVLYMGQTDRTQEERGGGVAVCTVHAAKGREWDTVVVVECEEGNFPSEQSVKDGSVGAMEEERRLMFVAVTRARRRLWLTWCSSRTAPFGPAVVRPQQRSRFVAEAGL